MFKNGTNDDAFARYPFMNSTSDVPVSTFINTLQVRAQTAFERPTSLTPPIQPYGFSDIPTWCQRCNNTKDRGCANIAINSTPAIAIVGSRDKVSPVGAGFIGASVTLVVMLAALALLSFTGFLSFGRKEKSRAKNGSEVCFSYIISSTS
jgi:prostatic aicd phosphatase